MGQVLPTTEDCQTAVDENCDGATPACAAGWAKGFGNASYAQHVATDSAGNVFVMGQFDESVDFGGGNTLTDVGVGDLYVVKLSPNGDHVWSHQLGDPLDFVQPGGLETDSAGNVYVAFNFVGDPTILGTSLQEESNGQGDAALARILADGTVDWVMAWGSSGFDAPYGITVDANDEPILAVVHGGPIYFGGQDVLTPPMSTAPVALVKLDTSGGHVYSRDTFWMGGSFAVLDTDPVTNDVVLAGHFQGSVDLGMGAVSATNGTFFLGRFDEAGGPLSYAGLGGPVGYQSPQGIEASPDGSVTVIGRFSGELDLGQPDPIPQGADSYFLTRLDSAGAPVHVRTFQAGGGQGVSIAVTALSRKGSDEVVIAGIVTGNTDLGGGTIADTTFLASYDPAGAFLGQQLLDFPMGYVYINDSAIAPDGVLVISGVYQGTGVTLGGTVLPDNNLAGSGYVARLAP